ncbi:MAG: hypothetical protein ACM3X9_05310 [Bacillota bacterium]
MSNAVELAKEKVRSVLGELIELHPAKVPTDWISEYTGISDIEYIDPKAMEIRFLEYQAQNDQIIYHHISPKQVLFIGGYYLIQEEGLSGHWLVGDLGESGFIDCWSRTASLKEAIDTI